MDQSPWDLTEGGGPLLATAIHDGHELRPEVGTGIALGESDRLREEDPFTGGWTRVAPTRLVARRSRFEFDLNRPRDRAVYIKPEDAWGLEVWGDAPPADVVERSLAEYDAFYAQAHGLLSGLAERHGRFVVFDIHSYNHHRGGPGSAPDDPALNPEVNIGTGTMERARWAPLVDRFIDDLRSAPVLGRGLDVRENVKFRGGQWPRWVHETFPETGCAIAVEFKKFFMDEWTGAPSDEHLKAIEQALHSTVPGVLEELAKLGGRI